MSSGDAMSSAEHKQAAAAIQPRCAIVTLSDTRTPATDRSGAAIASLLRENGCTVVRQELIRDDAEPFRQLLQTLLRDPQIDCVISTGGTGISRRDQAIDVAEKLLDTPLPGFGELFRMLSFEQVGSAAMLSRAVGGVAGAKLLFALPGSTAAVELAMQRLILPELRHLLAQLAK